MRRLSLLARFSIISLVLFVTIGAILGYSLTNFLKQQALSQQEVMVSSLMGPIARVYVTQDVLTNSAFPPPANATAAEKAKYPYTRLSQALSEVSGAGLVRIKIWNRDGRVVYSDDTKQVGQLFPMSDDLENALDGHPSADISSLAKAENLDEKRFGQLLEVYTPLRLGGQNKVSGAIEGYYDMANLQDRIDRTTVMLWGSIVVGFLILYLTLFTLVRNASMRILKQSNENLALLNDTERKAARLETLNEVARSISHSSPNLDEVFRAALGATDRIVQHSGASITLYDDCSGSPVHTVCSPTVGAREVAAEEIEGEMALIENGGTFICGDTRLASVPVLQSLAQQGLLSLLAIPIRLGDRNLGMLRMVSNVPECFDAEDVAILEGVADQLAVAIENNRLIRETAETTALRETNLLKDEFVSMVSHELRTPLASIKGYSRTLLAADGQWDEPTRHEFIRVISDESDKLQDLVENLLEMSRIEAGRLPIATEPVLLKHFCREVVGRVADQHPDIRFACDIEGSLPVVQADPRRLEQVLTNLLQNAAQYSGSDMVSVSASANPAGDEVTVCVSDCGSGIAPEHLPHLFDKFYRAQNSQTDLGSGTGLGLAIARALVEAQGGRIWAESALGEGTRFFFTLPTVAVEEEQAVG